jgi:SAM-dependent methyltransferase
MVRVQPLGCKTEKLFCNVTIVMTHPSGLRLGFDEEALLYEKARPTYPPELFDNLLEVTGSATNAAVLEIGPGTGQATKALAKRGYAITAVEIGRNLAAAARELLKKYPNVRIVNGAFEDVDLDDSSFDLVLAATAIHWVHERVRFTKSHNLLRSGGHLAIIHSEHVSDEQGDHFFEASQPIYQRHGQSDAGDHFRLPKARELRPTVIDDKLFDTIYFRVFPLVLHYSAQSYSDLLNTFSQTRAMPAHVREAFLRDIRSLIERVFGGSLQKHYAMTLTIARKREQTAKPGSDQLRGW